MNPKLPQYTIYCATCKVTGKSYIGKTSQAIWTRWAKHFSDAENFKSGKRVHHLPSDLIPDLAKYGDEAFDLEILEVCESQEKMDEREIWWMMERKTMVPFGYNRHLGKKVLHSEFQKEKRLNDLFKCNPQRMVVVAIKDGVITHFDSLKDFCKFIGVSMDTLRRRRESGLFKMKGYSYDMRKANLCPQ